jgi:DNA-binding transcriptional MerR regulator
MDSNREDTTYSIGEVSDMVGHEPHVLRYWEQEFDALSPDKNDSGRRTYTDDDVGVVERIRHLLKVEKYTIAGARQVMQRDGERRRRQAEFENNLRAVRSLLVDLYEGLGNAERSSGASQRRNGTSGDA